MAWLVLALVLAPLPARAQTPLQTPVDLQLVLAIDTSGSVNQYRFELQRQGYAEAFRSSNVLKAIRSGINGAIAVTATQWTGPELQVQVVEWMIIKDEPSAAAFAGAIEDAPRRLFGGGTSISGAIDHAASLLFDAARAFPGARRTIDVSGDGANNRGRPAHYARDEAVRNGITINGLPILALEPGLDRYYYDNVIGGPGAFMVAAQTYEKFAEAVLKKLIIEIAARPDRSAVGWAKAQESDVSVSGKAAERRAHAVSRCNVFQRGHTALSTAAFVDLSTPAPLCPPY